MNKQLVENNYLYIPHFISKWKATSLAKSFEEFSQKEQLGGDEQAPNSSSCYNFVDFTELLCDKVQHVSKIIGEKVFPTYVYGRIYRKGDDLKIHRDRDACEISLTVNLFQQEPWPIYVKTPRGETSKVYLQPGDAMVYLGCDAEHWRDELQDEKHTQVFLHYVRSRGPRAEFIFDAKNAFVKKVRSPSPAVQNAGIPSLSEHILYLPDLFDKQLADDLLNEYKNTDEWEQSTIGGGVSPVADPSIRGAFTIPMSIDPVIEVNRAVRKELDERMHEAAMKALKTYMEKFPDSSATMDTGYEILRYGEGTGYKKHVDDFSDFPRILSCSFALNDDFEGGEFTFFDEALSFKQEKGSALIFPSNFMFPHQVNLVTKGTRYSVITWYR